MYTWELNVRSPSGSQKALYTHADEGFSGVFAWTLLPSGECVQMTFDGVRRRASGEILLDIDARDILELWFRQDGSYIHMFAGHVESLPNPFSSGAGPNQDTGRLEQFSAVGLSERLKEVLMDGRAITTRQDVAEFSKQLADDLLPPGIIYAAANIPDTGFEFEEVSQARGFPLFEIMDSLAQSIPGVAFGVNAFREFFFREPSGTWEWDYQDLHLEFPRVDARDVVTAVEWVVLGKENRQPWSLINNGGGSSVSYIPANMGHLYEDDEHSTYGVAIGMQPPIGWNPWKPPRAPSSTTGVTNPGNMHDGDLTTFAEADGNNILIDFELPASERLYLVGYELVYEDEGALTGFITIDYTVGSNNNRTAAVFLVTPVSDKTTQMTIFPPGSQLDLSSLTLARVRLQMGAASQIKLYQFRPLVINDEDLDRYAQSLIRLPQEEVVEILIDEHTDPRPNPFVPGHVEPRATVKINNFPGVGTLELPATEYQYEMSPSEGMRTRIMLGSTSTDDQIKELAKAYKDDDRSVRNASRNYTDRIR